MTRITPMTTSADRRYIETILESRSMPSRHRAYLALCLLSVNTQDERYPNIKKRLEEQNESLEYSIMIAVNVFEDYRDKCACSAANSVRNLWRAWRADGDPRTEEEAQKKFDMCYNSIYAAPSQSFNFFLINAEHT